MLSNSKIPYYGKTRTSGVMSVETLCDLTCFSSRSSELYGECGFEAAFDGEIMTTSKNYSYSGTLQIMALASVLGVPIETVYPDQNHKLLPVYQNIFRPRQLISPTSSEVVRILWTNTLGWPDRSKEFVVNHFVPFFNLNDKVSDKPQSSSVTGKDEAQEQTENPWHVVTRKRKPSTKHSAKVQESGSTKKSQGHLKPQRATSYPKQKFEAGKNKTRASGGSSSLQEQSKA